MALKRGKRNAGMKFTAVVMSVIVVVLWLMIKYNIIN